MKLQPRNGLVTIRLIKEDTPERKTEQGIVIPSRAGDVLEKAEILAVGRGIFDAGIHAHTDDLKPGMIVLIKAGQRGTRPGERSYTYFDMTVGGETVLLINQADIWGILQETN